MRENGRDLGREPNREEIDGPKAKKIASEASRATICEQIMVNDKINKLNGRVISTVHK